jgi:hypothetical protein
MDEVGLIIIVLWVVMSAFGFWVASQKNRNPVEGLLLGLLFGPFGVLIEALLPTNPSQGKPSQGKQSPVAGQERSLDERGHIAFIANRYLDVLEQTDPQWRRLPYHRRRAIVKSIDKQLMKELNFNATHFGDLAADAKRNVLTQD